MGLLAWLHILLMGGVARGRARTDATGRCASHRRGVGNSVCQLDERHGREAVLPGGVNGRGVHNLPAFLSSSPICEPWRLMLRKGSHITLAGRASRDT